MNALLIESADQLTQAHYNVLAKARQLIETGREDGWQDDQPFDDHGAACSRDTLAITHEPMSAFDGSTWREKSGRRTFMVDGLPCIHWESVQVAKGQPRCELTVVDCGGIRLCYKV